MDGGDAREEGQHDGGHHLSPSSSFHDVAADANWSAAWLGYLSCYVHCILSPCCDMCWVLLSLVSHSILTIGMQYILHDYTLLSIQRVCSNIVKFSISFPCFHEPELYTTDSYVVPNIIWCRRILSMLQEFFDGSYILATENLNFELDVWCQWSWLEWGFAALIHANVHLITPLDLSITVSKDYSYKFSLPYCTSIFFPFIRNLPDGNRSHIRSCRYTCTDRVCSAKGFPECQVPDWYPKQFHSCDIERYEEHPIGFAMSNLKSGNDVLLKDATGTGKCA